MNKYLVTLKSGEQQAFEVERELDSFLDMIASGMYAIRKLSGERIQLSENNVQSVEQLENE